MSPSSMVLGHPVLSRVIVSIPTLAPKEKKKVFEMEDEALLLCMLYVQSCSALQPSKKGVGLRLTRDLSFQDGRIKEKGEGVEGMTCVACSANNKKSPCSLQLMHFLVAPAVGFCWYAHGPRSNNVALIELACRTRTTDS